MRITFLIKSILFFISQEFLGVVSPICLFCTIKNSKITLDRLDPKCTMNAKKTD